jgi:hypothetical protein
VLLASTLAASAGADRRVSACCKPPYLFATCVSLKSGPRCGLVAAAAQLQGELEHVDESKAVMEAHLDSAIRTGASWVCACLRARLCMWGVRAVQC